MNRRKFLRRTAAGGAVLTAGALYLGLKRGDDLPEPKAPLHVLDTTSYGIYVLFAQRILPFDGVDVAAVVHRIDLSLRYLSEEAQAETNLVLAVLENSLSGVLTRGSMTLFSELSAEDRDEAVRRWGASNISMLRGAVNGLRKLCIGSYYGPLEAAMETGYPGTPIGKIEPPAIQSRRALSKPWSPS